MAASASAVLRCYYDVLGIDRDASSDAIKVAYKKLALLYHPDKNRADPETAMVKFKELQNAYTVLSDGDERQWYDDHRDSILRGGGRWTGGGGRDDGAGDSDDDDEEEYGSHLFHFMRPGSFDGFVPPKKKQKATTTTTTGGHKPSSPPASSSPAASGGSATPTLAKKKRVVSVDDIDDDDEDDGHSSEEGQPETAAAPARSSGGAATSPPPGGDGDDDDDDEAMDFYSVYHRVFRGIAVDDNKEVRRKRNTTSTEATKSMAPSAPLPDFGSSDTPYATVLKFYNHWTNFQSKLSFAWRDQYRASDLPDRFQRRAADRINGKERETARRDYNKLVQRLAAYVHRRDPRVEREMIKRQEEEEEKQKVRERQHAVRMAKLAATEKQWMEEAKQKEEGERAARREKRRQAQVAAAGEASVVDADAAESDDDLEEEVHDGSTIDLLYAMQAQAEAERKRQQKKEEADRLFGPAGGGQGEMPSSVSGGGGVNSAAATVFADAVASLRCAPCKKTFATKKLLDEHLSSSKHKAKVKQMIAKGELPREYESKMEAPLSMADGRAGAAAAAAAGVVILGDDLRLRDVSGSTVPGSGKSQAVAVHADPVVAPQDSPAAAGAPLPSPQDGASASAETSRRCDGHRKGNRTALEDEMDEQHDEDTQRLLLRSGGGGAPSAKPKESTTKAAAAPPAASAPKVAASSGVKNPNVPPPHRGARSAAKAMVHKGSSSDDDDDGEEEESAVPAAAVRSGGKFAMLGKRR